MVTLRAIAFHAPELTNNFLTLNRRLSVLVGRLARVESGTLVAGFEVRQVLEDELRLVEARLGWLLPDVESRDE